MAATAVKVAGRFVWKSVHASSNGFGSWSRCGPLNRDFHHFGLPNPVQCIPRRDALMLRFAFFPLADTAWRSVLVYGRTITDLLDRVVWHFVSVLLLLLRVA
jgi:hypothetical protein